MAVATFQPKKNNTLVTIFVYILALAGVGLLIFFGGRFVKNFRNVRGKSAFLVEVLHGEAEVYLNDEFLGKIPFESEDIDSGDNKITVKSSSSAYEVTLSFMSNTQVVVKRDLGVSETFSSGQNFWIEESDSNSVLSVITDPDGASVYVDNTEVGTSPYSSSDLSDGEYDLRVEAPGYETQTARIKIQKGYKLNSALKLFPVPVPVKVDLMEGSSTLYSASSENSLVTSDPQRWVKAILYWNETRGINLSGSGVNKDLVFDFFIDYEGRVSDSEGNLVPTEELATALPEGAERGVYLGRISEGSGLSEEAKISLETLGSVATGKKAKILETGTGWLRVRDVPGLEGQEVGRVDVGGEFSVLEESVGWVKITVSSEVEGWVSSTYVEIIE